MTRHTAPRLASIALGCLGLSSPLTAQAGQFWSFGVTSTGQDVFWTSPTPVNPNAVVFNTEFTLTAFDVEAELFGISLGSFDVIDQVPPELLEFEFEVAGPAPVLVNSLSVIYPEPPAPTAFAADMDINLDAAGFCTFSATNIVLGTLTVDLGFPLGVQDVNITSVHVAGDISMHPTWYDLGGALAGTGATPATIASGKLSGNSDGIIGVTTGLPFGSAYLVIGLSQLGAPFKGGTLWPSVDILIAGLPLDASGDISVPFVWPAGVPSRASIYIQWWMPDPGAIVGFSSSNGVRGETP